VGWEIVLLGGFEVAAKGVAIPAQAWRHRRAAELVKILALVPTRRMAGEQVVDLLWPEMPPEAGAANLRKAAHFARGVLGSPDAVTLGEGRVSLLPGSDVTVDALRFERAADVALRGRWDADLLGQAAELYGGELLPADRYAGWAEEPRQRLRLKYLELLRRSRQWERLVEEEPLDEEAHRALMEGWLARGNRHAALVQFRRLEELLAWELGVRPSAETLRVWRTAKGADPVTRATPPPILGRDRELGVAMSAWELARTGHGGSLLVSGEAGIGKTRFCDEAVAVAAADGAMTVRVTATPEESSTPFGVILRALRPVAAERHDLVGALRPQARAVLDELKTAGDWGMSPLEGPVHGVQRQRVFSAVTQFVDAAAEPHGLLLVAEDVHHADDGSLELLAHIGESAAHHRLLLVLSHRSEAVSPELSRLRGLLLERRHTQDIALDRLSPQAAASLVARVARGLVSDDTAAAVWSLAEGNPFYTEELAAAIHADGTVHVPDRLYEVTWARLQRLPPLVREALQKTAVTGHDFTTAEFVAATGTDVATALNALEVSLRAGVIVEHAAGYMFRHALVRKTLERSVPRHQRQRIHAQAASRLAVSGREPARIAHHLVQSGNDIAAVPWLIRGAMRAAALGSYSDGLRLATDALVRSTPGDEPVLLALRADMLYATGDPSAVTAYDVALAVADREQQPRLRLMKARALLATGAVNEAKEALTQAEAVRREDRVAKDVISGLIAWTTGDIDAAERWATDAREGAVAAGLPKGVAEATEVLALVAHSRGQWRDLVRHDVMDAMQRREEMSGSVFDAHLCLAEYLLYGLQPYDEVIEFAGDLRRTATATGAGRGEAFATCVLGEAELLAGRLTKAEEHLEEAIRLHESVSASAGQALSMERLAEVALAGGDSKRADAWLAEAERVSQGSSLERHLVPRIYGAMVRSAPDACESLLVVEHAEARMHDLPVCQPCAIGFYVEATIACARQGEWGRAKDYLSTAEELSHRWPGGGWHAAVLEARAEVARAAGRPAEAARLFQQSSTTYARAGQPLAAERCRLAAHP
jgi:DNA-binding SARP family transcriptional activator/tetratricopeptide (TPR) repeat protein